MCIVLVHLTAYAQNEIDALRFSYTGNGGTARSLAMGNAFGALGADLSSLYVNPAGHVQKKRGLIGFWK